MTFRAQHLCASGGPALILPRARIVAGRDRSLLATRYPLPTTALSKRSASKGFTLLELLVGMSLAMVVMTAVLTVYITLGRSFTRSLGVSSANQPTLASQARRTLAMFAQDVRMASDIDLIGVDPRVTPTASKITLVLPTGTSTPKYVTYFFNSTASAVPLSSYTIPAFSLVRIDLGTSTAQTLHANLLSAGFTFNYYDNSGTAYTSADLTAGRYLKGIKQLALSFTSQAGSATNGTLTQVYQVNSPRLLIRNKALLQ